MVMLRFVMGYFKGEKHIDPSFFLKYIVDGESCLEKLFWCDRASHIDYKTFEQVLIFDTIYKCNATISHL